MGHEAEIGKSAVVHVELVALGFAPRVLEMIDLRSGVPRHPRASVLRVLVSEIWLRMRTRLPRSGGVAVLSSRQLSMASIWMKPGVRSPVP